VVGGQKTVNVDIDKGADPFASFETSWDAKPTVKSGDLFGATDPFSPAVFTSPSGSSPFPDTPVDPFASSFSSAGVDPFVSFTASGGQNTFPSSNVFTDFSATPPVAPMNFLPRPPPVQYYTRPPSGAKPAPSKDPFADLAHYKK
jgi:hypothetical protein